MSSIDLRRLDQSFRLGHPDCALYVFMHVQADQQTQRQDWLVLVSVRYDYGWPSLAYLSFVIFWERESGHGTGLQGISGVRRAFKSIASSGCGACICIFACHWATSCGNALKNIISQKLLSVLTFLDKHPTPGQGLWTQRFDLETMMYGLEVRILTAFLPCHSCQTEPASAEPSLGPLIQCSFSYHAVILPG